jgi:hypothetical protein
MNDILDPPPAAAAFLAAAGIEWPRVDVGDLRELSGSGPRGQRVLESWEQWSVEHIEELTFRCQVAAEILQMAEVMDGLAGQILQHAEEFSRRTGALDFE